MPNCKGPLSGLICELWTLPGSQRLRKLSLLSPVTFLHQTLHLLFYFYKSIFMLLGCKAILQFVHLHDYQSVAIPISLPNSCSHQWMVSC